MNVRQNIKGLPRHEIQFLQDRRRYYQPEIIPLRYLVCVLGLNLAKRIELLYISALKIRKKSHSPPDYFDWIYLRTCRIFCYGNLKDYFEIALAFVCVLSVCVHYFSSTVVHLYKSKFFVAVRKAVIFSSNVQVHDDIHNDSLSWFIRRIEQGLC